MKTSARFLLLPLLLAVAGSVARAQTAGQDSAAVVDSARAVVEHLCAADLAGRGYLRQGHANAVRYLGQAFRALGAGGVRTQDFTFDIRVFPATPTLWLNGGMLKPGIDFIPHEQSGSLSNEKPVETSYVMTVRGLRLDKDGYDFTGDATDGYYRVRAQPLRALLIGDTVLKTILSDTTLPDTIRSVEGLVNLAALRGCCCVLLARSGRLTGGISTDTMRIPALIVQRAALPDTLKNIRFSVSAETRHITSSNLIAEIKGTGGSDSVLVVCAHYDHLGALGDSVYFPGANDNASGTAMMLALARHFQAHPIRYTVVFIAFGGEEAGLLGSRHFVQNPTFNLHSVRFVLNTDMCASGRDGVMACGGTDFPQEFALMSAVNDSLQLGQLRKRPNAPNSDQYFFIRYGMRGFYAYPFTGYQPYHHIDDKPETLQWDVFYKLYRLFRGFLEKM